MESLLVKIENVHDYEIHTKKCMKVSSEIHGKFSNKQQSVMRKLVAQAFKDGIKFGQSKLEVDPCT